MFATSARKNISWMQQWAPMHSSDCTARHLFLQEVWRFGHPGAVSQLCSWATGGGRLAFNFHCTFDVASFLFFLHTPKSWSECREPFEVTRNFVLCWGLKDVQSKTREHACKQGENPMSCGHGTPRGTSTCVQMLSLEEKWSRANVNVVKENAYVLQSLTLKLISQKKNWSNNLAFRGLGVFTCSIISYPIIYTFLNYVVLLNLREKHS